MPDPIALTTRALTMNNDGKAGEYAASVKFSSGAWCLAIECGWGAWGTWSLKALTEKGISEETYIDFGSGFRCTNMRALIAEALIIVRKMNRVEGECS